MKTRTWIAFIFLIISISPLMSTGLIPFQTPLSRFSSGPSMRQNNINLSENQFIFSTGSFNGQMFMKQTFLRSTVIPMSGPFELKMNMGLNKNFFGTGPIESGGFSPLYSAELTYKKTDNFSFQVRLGNRSLLQSLKGISYFSSFDPLFQTQGMTFNDHQIDLFMEKSFFNDKVHLSVFYSDRIRQP